MRVVREGSDEGGAEGGAEEGGAEGGAELHEIEVRASVK